MTVATAGRAVFFSGLTVLLGLLGLVLFEFTILRSVGIAGAIVVGVAVLAALTLLPAILSILGRRLDRWRSGGSTPRLRPNEPWARLARRVMRRPLRSSCHPGPAAVLGTPFLHVRLNAPDATILPPSVPSRVGLRPARRGLRCRALRAARAGDPDRPAQPPSPANIAALYDYSRRLAADPASHRGGRLRGPGPAAHAWPVPAPLRIAGRPARSIRRRRPWRRPPRAT